MKRLLVTLICCFLAACATSGSIFAPPVRTVKENVFCSDKDPKIAIKVDSKFQYLGIHTFNYTKSWPDWAAGVKETVYLFNGIADNHVEISFGVDFKEIDQGHWRSQCIGKTSRYVELAGKTYCFTEYPSEAKDAFGPVADYTKANNLDLNPFYIIRDIRLKKDGNKVDFHLYYFESVSKDMFYKFKVYLKNKNALMPQELKDHLNAFDQRCRNSFEIITDYYQ